MTCKPCLLALFLTGCAGGSPDEPVTQITAMECTVPIDIKAGDYTTDLMGEWLWMPDIHQEVRIVEPCV